MSDIFATLDFASDFFGQPDRNKQKISRREYISQDVDYYRQGLDSTGIKVSDPERWSDIDDNDEDRKRDIDISQVGISEGDNESTADIGNLSSGVDNALSSSSSLGNINASFVDYNTSLQNAGFKDRSQSFLSKQFGISLASVPQSGKEAKEDIKSLKTEKGIQTLATSAAKKGLGLLGINPIATSLITGFATGTKVQDPLGQPSFRPNHAVLGTVMDINFSMQSNNISQSIAAMNANLDVPYSQRGAVGYFGYINGQVVSRAPLGKTFTGVTDLSIEQLSNLDALSKGFTTSGYNNQTERGEQLAMGTGVDSLGQTTSGYGNNGFHHGINGSSRTGTMSDAKAAAKGYGITTKQFTDILSKVRKNNNFWGKPKNDKLTLDFLARKQYRDNATADGPGNLGLETDINAQVDIQNALSKGIGVNEFGGVTQDTLSDVQDINAANPGIGTSTGAGAVGSTGGLSETYGGGSEGTDSNDSNSSDMGGMTAKGGFIGKKNFALGGRGDAEPAGFIGGPPEQFNDQTTIADDIPLKVKDGTFVINAPAVEYAGSIDVQKMLAEGYKKAMTRDIGVDKNFRIGKIPSREELDIQISRGEVVVPPHVAKAIGYDRLEKINNRGKREVERRQKAGDQEKVQAGQGFAAKGGNFATGDGVFTIDKVADSYKEKYATPQLARQATMKLARKMPLADALAILMWGEAKNLGDEGLEGAAHVLINRANAENYPGFGKDIYNEITRTYKGAKKGERIFEFNAYEPTKFRETIKRFKKDKDAYLRVRNIAEEVMAGARKDFTNNALFFWNPNTSGSSWYKGKVNRKEFKETTRTVNSKDKKVLHVYHVPSDFKMDTKLSTKTISPKQFEPSTPIPSNIPLPMKRPDEIKDRSDDGGFLDYLRKLF
jgi:hypothetical protein